MTYDIELKQLVRQETAVIRTNCRWDQIAETIGRIFGEVWSRIGEAGAQPTGAAFGRFTPAGAEVAIEAGFLVAAPITPGGRVEAGELPACDAAVCLYVGSYDAVPAVYEAVQAWAKEHKREAAGPPWEVYLTPPEVQPPRTEVVLPLRALG